MNPEDKNNLQNDSVNQNSINKIETIDLNVKPTNNEPQASKDGNGVLIIVFLIIGLFVLFLPVIDSYLKKIDLPNNGIFQIKEKSSNLHNGLIQIGKESYMTVSNIKFYNFTKKSNNTINFNYIASKKITDIQNLNIYIELYNNSEDLIYRIKFNEFDKIEKSMVESYDLKIAEDIFINSNYAKAFIINSEVLSTTQESILTCVLSTTDEDVNLDFEVKYYFKLDELIRYDIDQSILYDNEVESEKLLEYKENLNEEYNLILAANATNVVKEDLKLSYTIDFDEYDSESEFEPLFLKGTLKSTVDYTNANDSEFEWECN